MLMGSLRKTKKSTLYLWVILLSVALLGSQGLKMHVHDIGHDHHSHSDQITMVEHSHVSIAHLSLDDSHGNHHDKVIYESDACPECLLTKVFNIIPLTGLISLLFILLLFGSSRYTTIRQGNEHNIQTRWQHFTPLLRAPPL